MKLWQKEGAKVNELIEKFTVGRDKAFDIVMDKYDVEGYIAHASMLERKIGRAHVCHQVTDVNRMQSSA